MRVQPTRVADQARRGGPRLDAVAGPQMSRLVPKKNAAISTSAVAPGTSTVAARSGAEKEMARQRSHSSTGS